MSDDLIKRLQSRQRWIQDPLCDEAAAALAEAQADVERLVHDLERLKDSETHQLNRAEQLEAENAGLKSAILALSKAAALAHPIADVERVAQKEGE